MDAAEGDRRPLAHAARYKKADYFARNVRTIQVLIDRESILTGAAASGEQPWKYYDLGEGYCSYDFFAKCPPPAGLRPLPVLRPQDLNPRPAPGRVSNVLVTTTR
ncbi:hypothetical protein ABZ402_50135 [Streptomyces mirabilis]|uniref:hypothetical protein n=1 Tax=Streptomyces mirabilis TaxID=68239 RepID=UPI0033F44C68